MGSLQLRMAGLNSCEDRWLDIMLALELAPPVGAAAVKIPAVWTPGV